MKAENALTAARIALSPAVFALIILGRTNAAVAVFAAAALTDAADGFFARKGKKKGKKKKSGSMENVFDAAADITLVYSAALAIAIVNSSIGLVLLLAAALAAIAMLALILKSRKKGISLHRISGKASMVTVCITIIAYLLGWEHAGKLFVAMLALIAYAFFDYLFAALNKKLYK